MTNEKTASKAGIVGKVVRGILGVVAALAVAMLLLIAVEGFSAVVHPFPPDFQGTHEEVCAHVARYPHWVLAVAGAMWGLTAFVSTWIAARIGGQVAGAFIGVLLVAGVVMNISMLPYPLWFEIVIVIVVAGCAVAGCRLLRGRKTAGGAGEVLAEQG